MDGANQTPQMWRSNHQKQSTKTVLSHYSYVNIKNLQNYIGKWYFMLPNFMFLLLLLCVIKVSSKLMSGYVQCQWWFSTWNAARKTQEKQFNDVMSSSDNLLWYSPELTVVKVETALRTRKIRLRNVFGWLGFVEQILKIAWLDYAGLTEGCRRMRTQQQQRRGCCSAFLFGRKRLQGKTTRVLHVHVAVLQLDFIHLLL